MLEVLLRLWGFEVMRRPWARNIGLMCPLVPRERYQRPKRQNVAQRAEAGNLTARHRGDHRVAAEFLAGVYVRKMNFDGGKPATGDCVADCDAVMGVRGGVDDKAVTAVRGVPYEAHYLALVVRLVNLHRYVQGPRFLFDESVDAVKGLRPVDTWLSHAQPVQVRAVNHHDSSVRHVFPLLI